MPAATYMMSREFAEIRHIACPIADLQNLTGTHPIGTCIAGFQGLGVQKDDINGAGDRRWFPLCRMVARA